MAGERTIAGRYRLLSVLGEGAMGVVYRAEQLDASGQPMREVAVKMLRPEFANDPDFARRFLREVRVAARLSNPNIVMVYDSGETEQHELFFSMELVRGFTLREVLRREGALAPERAVRILGQVCEALAEAHRLEEPVVHRDLKPDNVFIENRSGQDWVKVGDFGIAKVLGSGASQLTHVDAASPGTPIYMAPEQWKGEAVDPRTDLYALGVIAYEMFAGRLPFSADQGPMRLMYQTLEVPPAPLPETVPPTIAREIARLLGKRMDDRPADALTARRALERALAEWIRARIRAASPEPAAPRAAPPRPATARPPAPPPASPPLRPPATTEAAAPLAAPAVPPPPPAAAPPPVAEAGAPGDETAAAAKAKRSGREPRREPPARPAAGGRPSLRWVKYAAGAVLLVPLLLLGPLDLGDLFVWSAARGVKPLFSVLLSMGMNPNARDAEGRSVLLLAALRGDVADLRALLDRRAYVTTRDGKGTSALMAATLSGNPDAVMLLLERGAGIDDRDQTGATALVLAAERGLLDIARMLIEKNANPDVPGAEGETALMAAAARGDAEIVKLLLRGGADKRLRNGTGKTARDLAKERGHEDVARLLG